MFPKYLVSGPAHAAVRWADLGGRTPEDWQLLSGREPEITVYKRLSDAEMLQDNPAFCRYKNASAAFEAKRDELDSLREANGISGYAARITLEVIHLELYWNDGTLVTRDMILDFQDQVFRLTGFACLATASLKTASINSIFEDYGIVI